MISMRLKDVRAVIKVFSWFFVAMLILAYVLAWIIPNSTTGPLLYLAVHIVLVIAALVFRYNYWRCPICKKPLGQIDKGKKYCPNCGKELNWESRVDG